MPKKKRTALVIIHTDSLAAVADALGAARAEQLQAMILNSLDSDEFVRRVVVHQLWDTRYSREASKYADDVMVFDESSSPWAPFLKRLTGRLKKHRITHVVLGGAWYGGRGAGCVGWTETELTRRGFRVAVDLNLVAQENELEEGEE